jgi:hypothetical protein
LTLVKPRRPAPRADEPGVMLRNRRTAAVGFRAIQDSQQNPRSFVGPLQQFHPETIACSNQCDRVSSVR